MRPTRQRAGWVRMTAGRCGVAVLAVRLEQDLAEDGSHHIGRRVVTPAEPHHPLAEAALGGGFVRVSQDGCGADRRAADQPGPIGLHGHG